MSDRTTLRLLVSVAAQLELQTGTEPMVLPTVHDAVGPEEELLAAYARYYEGTFIRIESRPPGALGPVDAARASVARALFSSEGYDLRIDASGGRIEASFGGHSSPSGGLDTALRVAEIFVSSEIATPVVILAYPLAGMDSTVARLVWQLTGLSITDAPPNELRLWLPIAEGDISVGAHCTPPNAARLAVQRDRLIERRASTEMPAAIANILLKRDQPLVLFLGAGASVTAGVTLGDGIRSQALAQVTGNRGTLEAQAEAFRTWVAEHDRWREGEQGLTMSQFTERLTLERVLREEFHNLGGMSPAMSPTITTLARQCDGGLLRNPPGRQALRELMALLPRLVVATVNFDRLIEDGLAIAHELVITDAEMAGSRDLIVERLTGGSTPIPILKLHGSIEAPLTLIADIDQTEYGLPDQTAATLDAMLDADAEPLTWVWIGCSMRDVDLRAWLRRKDGVAQLREWWVDPLPSQSLFDYARYVRASAWAARDLTLRDRLVTEAADEFLPALLQHAETLAA